MARNAVNPLPTLLRATASDAADSSMRAAGRTKWSRKDWNEMCRVNERLVRACYGRPTDPEGSPLCYLRFGIAEQMQKLGHFDLQSDFDEINKIIDDALADAQQVAA